MAKRKSCCGPSSRTSIALAAEFPAVPAYRRASRLRTINLSNLLATMNRLPEALEICRAALEMAKKLATDFPTPYNRLVLGRCYYNLGVGLDGKQDEQEATYRAGNRGARKTCGRAPGT